MAIVDTGLFRYPGGLMDAAANNLIGSSLLIDAAGEKVALIFEAPEDGDITAYTFRIAAAAVAGNVDARIETVDAATGEASGTLFATNTNATVAISTANTYYTATLTAPATVTRGQRIAIVLANLTGSYAIATLGEQSGFPYASHFTTVWTKQSVMPVLNVSYGGTHYPIPWVFPGLITSFTFNSGSGFDENGVLFTAPFSARVCGVYAYVDADGDCEVVIYNSADTVLATAALDKDVRMSAAGNAHNLLLTNDVMITEGEQYRVVLKPSTTTNVALFTWTVADNAYDALFSGSNWQQTVRGDAGAWNNTGTARPMLGLLIDGIEVGGGSGGGLITHPGMSGGMRG